MPYCLKNVAGPGLVGRVSITIVLGLVMLIISAAQAQAIDLNVSDDGLSFVFQNDGEYTSAQDDDTKQEGFLFLGKPEGKKHLIRFGDLDRWVRGEGIEIIEAELRLYYYDEWWTQNVYHVAVARSLDGTVNSMAKAPESEVKIYGDKFPKGEKTPRPSWISFPIRPEVLEEWVRHNEQNHGLVLYVSDIEWHEKNFGLWFQSCSGQADQRPQLYVRYRLRGNGPPTVPKLNQIPAGWRVCREASISWLPSKDPNSDEVHYELEEGVETARGISWSKADVVFDGPTIVKWKPKQKQLSDARYFIRVRALDSHGAASNWAQIGPFVLTDQLMTIWGAHGNRKIRPHFLPSQKGRTIKIAAARNEWEPFQIIISPHTDVKGLTISATPLTDGAGHKISSPTLYVERYIDIKASPNPWGDVGLWPDALVPLIHPVSGKPTGGKYGGNRFNLVLGENLVFWADVYVGKDVHPGTYKGDVIVKAEGMPPAVLPIEIKVYNFTLPSPKHLTAIFQMEGGSLKHFHGVSKLRPSDPRIKDLPHLYEEELHCHYINNWSPITGWNYTANGMKVSVSGDNLVVDWSQFDKIITPYMDGTAYKDGIPAQWLFVPYWLPVKAGPKAAFTEREDRLLTQFVHEVVRHFKEKGWLDRTYYWVIDEPFIKEWKYNFFLHIAKIVRREAPELKIFVTDVHKEANRLPKHVAEALDPYIDVWDPTVQQVIAGWNVLPDYYLNRKRTGYFDIWCQTIMSAARKVPWLNLYPEYPMSFHRIWGWYSWKYGFQGIEWWDTVLWWDTQKKERIDPWENPVAFRSDRPVNCEGRIFYPGTSEAIGGSEIPISSLRLKAVREAIEDYEYLYLLSSLGGDEDVSQLMETLITLDERYTKFMKKPLMTVPGGTPQERKITSWWEADEDALMEVRARLAELIEKRM